jgi:hypothetical protein
LEFQGDRLDALREFLADNDLALIGFNNRNYDDQIIRAIVERRVDSVPEIHSLSKLIVEQDGNRRDRQLKRWYYDLHPWITIDLMQIKPESISGKVRDWSLKKHEIRVRWHDVRDLPFDPHKVLTDVEKAEVVQYCYNDAAFTVELWKRFNDDALDGDKISALTAFGGKIIEDGLKSDKDKALVKQVLCSDTPRLGLQAVLRRYEKATHESAWKIKQNKPREILFDPKEMIFPEISFQGAKNTEYLSYLRSLDPINVVSIQYDPLARRETNREGLRQVLNVVKELQFEIGEAKFSLGVGGVHSAIPSIVLVNRNILDADVTSYYPALILKAGRSPVGFRRAWIDNFRAMVDQRVEAKRAKDVATAAFLKICLNFQYGNLNSHTSEIFDPALALTVTINGQLSLLMLAEMLHLAGFEILSINTDGVTTIVDDREDDAKAVCAQWEQRIGLQLVW